MIDTKALRSRVLDLAVQGKLTEQLESDGNTEDLFSSKLKDFDEDIPFDIPNNWKWVKLSDIGTTNIGLTYHPTDVVVDGTIVIRSSNIVNGKMDYSDIVRVNCEIKENQYLNRNDIVICARNGSKALVGKNAIYTGESNEVAFGAFMAVFRTIYYQYVHLFFNTKAFRRYFSNDDSKQINQVTQGILKDSAIPLPPLAEQKRIVERVEEIFRVLDTIDEAQEKYYNDVESLKTKLVTAGIQGKLTEQLESDGTAEELHQQIQAEKQKLIKEGKIKKEKPLPEIKPEEVPFEIPGNWKWVYLGEIFQHNTGKALNAANTEGELLEYITTSNVYWDRFELDSLKQMHFTDSEIEKCTIRKGDLLICEGGDIGRSAIWNFDYEMRIQNHLHRLRGYIPDICQKYYYFLMWMYKNNGMIDGRGIGLQGFSSKRVHSLVVPLPPLAEQKRIADILDKALETLG